MTTTTETPWFNTMLTTLDQAAESVSYHFPKWMERDDLYQTAWEWALIHPKLVESLLDRPTPDTRTLQRYVQDYLREQVYREKAHQSGYSPDDSQFYTPRMVAELLRASMDITAEMEPKASASDGEGGRSSNRDGQGDYLVALFDVRNAWITTAFRQDEARLIEARYVDDMEWHHIAASFGHDLEEVKRRVALGLRRMVDTLGGHRGRTCPVECPDHAVTHEEGETR